jgi:MFS family permease
MNKRMFLYVKAFSDLGTMMDMIVLNAMVWVATGSTFWLAATMGLKVFGSFLSSLFSGILADRYSRKNMMIQSDIARGLLILLLIPFPDPMMILAVSFLIGFMGTFFQVSFSAEVPRMFGEDKVLETNALIFRLRSISLVVGFFSAGLISKFIGNELVLAIDAVSYLLSAVVLVKLDWGYVSEVKSATIEKVKKSLGVWKEIISDLREVKAYLWLRPILLIVFVVFLVATFGASSHNLGIPILADLLDPTSSFLYGLIWGVWGIGSVLTTFLLPKWPWVKDRLFAAFCVSTVMMSVGFITFLSNTSLWMILPFAFFTGVFDAGAGTLYNTIMQKSENHIRGRIFGISNLVISLGFGLGFMVAPFLLEKFTMPDMVWILHGCVITTTLIVFTAIMSGFKNIKTDLQATMKV